MALYKQLYQSPIGELSLVASDKGMRGIWFVGQKHFEKGMPDELVYQPTPILQQMISWLDNYFAGQQWTGIDLPLDVVASPFQASVWEILRTIPFGQTMTYGQIAERLGIHSAQAVGGAVGRNPLSILIPCHRVLGNKGQLTGYAAGLDKKTWLLKHEHIL